MITIIVPAYNEIKNLEKLIPILKDFEKETSCETVVALSAENSDGSCMWLKKFGVSFLKCQGIGRAAQMNEAAIIANGDILAFLHADVLPPLSFIKDIQQTLEGDFDAGFFSYRFDSESFFLKINASFTRRDGIFTGGGDQCLFIKKDIFEKLNAFDENQVLMEDFEFFDRIKKHNIPYKIIKNDLIVSARKYKHNSYLRVNLSNMLLMILYKLGHSSKKLKRLHVKLLKDNC